MKRSPKKKNPHAGLTKRFSPFLPALPFPCCLLQVEFGCMTWALFLFFLCVFYCFFFPLVVWALCYKASIGVGTKVTATTAAAAAVQTKSRPAHWQRQAQRDSTGNDNTLLPAATTLQREEQHAPAAAPTASATGISVR